MLQKYLTCSSVSSLQNNEMFENANCPQTVYLLQISAMFEKEIKNHQKLKVIR